jgi:hypothetical protein
MAAVAPSAPLASLQDVPEELLTRILSLACAGDDGLGAEELFRLGGLCAALRRACGSVEEAAAPMADTWSRAVIALVDPAAALLAAVSAQSRGLRTDARSCYFPQARALGGWYPLVHALANRECVECEDVTRLLACRIEAAQVASLLACAAAARAARRLARPLMWRMTKRLNRLKAVASFVALC